MITAVHPGGASVDALTFPLSTGDDDLRRDAMATMEAIRRIKTEIPGCFTALGLSNVSFGLKPAARHVLNSVFLDHAVKRGMTGAIVLIVMLLRPQGLFPPHRRPAWRR